MPLSLSWYVENRVLWIALAGDLNEDELRVGSDKIARMVAEAPDGILAVRDARGLRRLAMPESHLTRLSSWLKPPNFAGLVFLSDSQSIHLEVPLETVAKFKGITIESARSMEEAHQHLLTMDPSLTDALPIL